MVCIYCDGKTKVTNSRPQKKQNAIWRRRQCQKCHATFTSVENIEMTNSLLIASDSKHSEAFSRDKLLITVYDSLKHRKTALEDATALTNTIIGRVVAENSEAIVSKSFVSNIVIDVLNKFDSLAAAHYKAYYGS